MFIRQHLEDNEDLKFLFGDLKPPRKKIIKWGNSELQVIRSRVSRDPTIYAGGAGAGVFNRRFDIMILDDFPDPDPKKQEQISHRDAEWNWAMQVALTRVEPKTTAKYPYYGTKVIGSYSHTDDFHRRLQKTAQFATVIDPAIRKDNSLLDPEKWTMDDLMEKKMALGPHAFAMKYLCEVQDLSWVLFNLDAIRERCWNDALTFHTNRESIPDGLEVYMGVDLAIGEGADSSYFVVIVIGVDGDGNRVLLDIVRDRQRFPDQKQTIITKYRAFRPKCLVVENNAYQQAMVQDLEDQAIPVRSVRTGVQKADPLHGVPSLSLYIEQGKLQMPRGGTREVEICDIFTRELVEYPKGQTSDILMAWYLCEQGIDGEHYGYVHNKSPFQRKRPRGRRAARWYRHEPT